MRFFTSSKHCWPWHPLTASSGCICCERPFKPDRHGTDNVTPLWSRAVPSRIQAAQPHPPLQSQSAAWPRKLLPPSSPQHPEKNQFVLPEQAASEASSPCFLRERSHRLREPHWKSAKGGRGDVNRIWKQELFQREAHLERKENFPSMLLLEGLK